MTNFAGIFVGALTLNVLVTFRSSDYWKQWMTSRQTAQQQPEQAQDAAATAEERQKWRALLQKYLIVYLLATLSDWLQGPYVYALYSDYGYEQHDIAVLFVAGFGSSMVFGSFVGGMADWGGRRAFVILFAITYALSCFTKHFKDYWILMIGRLLGGIATSLLFSVFDAWLIRSHADAGIKSWLGKSFSWASYGNSIIAIVAGLVANKAASLSTMVAIYGDQVHVGGFLAPFDISLGALVLCGLCASSLWDENYGETGSASPSGASSKPSSPSSTTAAALLSTDKEETDAAKSSAKWYDGLKSAFDTTIRNQEILLCGIISSLFEGSMYIFVFFWTPSLQVGLAEDAPSLPFGLIFSTFMVCCMAGSSLFSVQIEYVKGEKLAMFVFGVAAMAMMIIAAFPGNTMKFLAMNLFEITVGMYFPIMGTMKGSIVPESKRAAIYNLYRIPLNSIVLVSLLTDLSPTHAFSLNGFMLSVATFLQYVLMKRREKSQGGATSGSGGGDAEERVAMLDHAEKGEV